MIQARATGASSSSSGAPDPIQTPAGPEPSSSQQSSAAPPQDGGNLTNTEVPDSEPRYRLTNPNGTVIREKESEYQKNLDNLTGEIKISDIKSKE